MTLTLADFGHGQMKWAGAALGERPLLLVLVNLNGSGGSLAHGGDFYADRVFGSGFAFNHDGTPTRNVRDHFLEMSCGRFTWKRTQPAVVGPITLTTQEATLGLGERRPRIVDRVRDEGLFDFAPYDLSRDRSVAGAELGVLIVDNGSDLAGQGGTASGIAVAGNNAGTGSVFITELGQRPSLTLLSHELSHHLGAHETYGPWGLGFTLNDNCSVMSNHEQMNDGTKVWHLDPWHKMRLGWAEPRLFDISTPLLPISLVAPGAQDPAGAALLYSPQKGTREFFIVEFRNPKQRSGRYDRDVASRGVAIWHIVTDARGDAIEIDWPMNKAHARLIFLEAVPPSGGVVRYFGFTDDDFQRGGSQLWDRGTMTAPLRWLDGTSAAFRLKVRDFADDADTAVVDVMPEPLRRQSSSGRLSQSNWGTNGNYELLVSDGASLLHFWRDNDDHGFPWRLAGEMRFGGASSGQSATFIEKVRSSSLLRSTICGDGTVGNLDAVVWLEDATGHGHLALMTFDSARRSWSRPQAILVNGSRIEGVTGAPALIQSDFGRFGNDEMLVPQGNALVHYWRANDLASRPWSKGAEIVFNPASDGSAQALAKRPLGVALVQNAKAKGDGVHGNYAAVAVLHSSLTTARTHLAWLEFDTRARTWSKPATLQVAGSTVDGVTGTPSIIQSRFGREGNYEMLVPRGSQLVHCWRDNDDPARPWRMGYSHQFGIDPNAGNATVARQVVGVSMLESTFKGDGVHGNFDAVVRLHSVVDDHDPLLFLAFDTGSRQWTQPSTIVASGVPVRER